MGRKSFSWKRAVGISGAKSRISRKIGIPLTRSGRRKKVKRATGCFIATATYGDKNCVQVQFLRGFRDEVLSKNRLGRLLTLIYYKGAPFPARLVEEVPILKRLARNVLDHMIELIEARTELRQEEFRERKN